MYLRAIAERILGGESATAILTGLSPQKKGQHGEAILRVLVLLGIHPTDASYFVVPYQTYPSTSRIEAISGISERLAVLNTSHVAAGGDKTDVSWRDGNIIAACSSKIGVVEVKSIADLEVLEMLSQFTEGKGYTESGKRVLRDSIVPYVLVNNRQEILLLAERSKASNKATKVNLKNILDLDDLNRMCAVLRERAAPCASRDIESILGHLISMKKPIMRNRLHQKLLRRKAIHAIARGNRDIGIFGLPRCGKTYIGADIAKTRSRILVLTPRPTETKPQWLAVFNSHAEFSDYKIVDLNSATSYEVAMYIAKGEKVIAVSSMQFMKGDEDKEALRCLAGIEWEIALLDEIHAGGSTELSNTMLDTYIGPKAIRIMMTATYTKPVEYYTIPSDCCFFWDLEDVRLMRNWGEPEVFARLCNKYGETDVTHARDECYTSGETDASIRLCYVDAPRLGILTNTMQSELYAELRVATGSPDNAYGFSMRSLFMTTKDGKAFQNQNAVDTFLALVSGSDKMKHYKKGDMSMFARIRRYWKSINHRECDEFMTQMWFLPFGVGQLLDHVKHAMITRLSANPLLAEFATLTLDAGMGDISKAVRDAVIDARAQGKKGLILLTGNVGSLGVSLPEVDIAFMLHDGESADLTYQQMMRVLTEMVNKKYGIVVDFNVWRVLATLNTYATTRCGQANQSSAERIRWCLSNLIDVDPDLWECTESPETFPRESIAEELTKHWLTMLEQTVKTLSTLARKPLDLGDDQKELDLIAKYLKGGAKATSTLQVNPDQEKLHAGIEQRGGESDTDTTTEKEEIVKKANLNDVLARLIPVLCLLSRCTPDLLKAVGKVVNNPTYSSALSEFLRTTYGSTARNPMCVLLVLIKRNYEKLTDARENYKVISDLMVVLLDNPKELAEFLCKHLRPKEVEKKKFGEVFTPLDLIHQKLDTLSLVNPRIWSDPSKKFLDPANGIGNYPALVFQRLMKGLADVIPDAAARKKHILENMLYMCEINSVNVELSRRIFDPENLYSLNLYEGSYLDLDPVKEWGVAQFHVILGNPPWNDASGNKGKGHQLWDQFIVKSLPLITQDGFLVFVHPAGWRQPGNKLLNTMKNKQIHYLSIHNEGDGLKTFHCNTRYDWYVLENRTCYKETTVTAQDGKIYKINLSTMSFIPNSMFEEIRGWTSGDSKLTILNERSAYGHDKKHMSKVKSNTHAHPAVYSVNRQNTPTLHYSSITTNGHFGIPKVIFGSGATGFISDPSGQYALTQWCTGIVDSPAKHQRIIEVLNHPTFKAVILACSVGKAEINAGILRFFRKDFFDTFELTPTQAVPPATPQSEYNTMTLAALKLLCKERKIKGITGKSKDELVEMLSV